MARKSLILGDRTTSAISASSSTLGITITHNQGSDFVIQGFQLMYNTSQEPVLVRLFDAQNNRDIIAPNTQLGTVGKLRTANPILPYVKIEPVVIRSGQSIQLYINNVTGSSIASGDIGLTLFGFQEI